MFKLLIVILVFEAGCFGQKIKGKSGRDSNLDVIYFEDSDQVQELFAKQKALTSTTEFPLQSLLKKRVDSLEEDKCGPTSECVPYYLCDNGQLDTNGSNIIDIRGGYDDTVQGEAGKCESYLDVCCETGDVLETIVPVVPATVANKCGIRNIYGVGFKITADQNNEAEFGEFPWMVTVLKEEKAAKNLINCYQCGGSLIHPSVVLTAAHCVHGKDASSLKVRAGEWDSQSNYEPFPYVEAQVESMEVHEDFVAATLINDIALLFLKTPINNVEHISNACLPPQDSNFDHIRCFTSGWGKDVFGKEGKYQVVLKKIELPVVPFQTCQKSLRTTILGNSFKLNKSFMCAGGEPGQDTCNGDGGSPLVCPIPGHNGHYYQAGIVASGVGCGETGVPGLYVNIAVFRNWIDQELRSKGFSSKSYSF